MNSRYERWRWQTFAITWLIYVSFYLTRQAFAVAKVALPFDPSVSLSRQSLGNIDSAFLIIYMLGQFIFGPLGDRFGPRRILLFGLGLSVAAAVGFGMSATLFAFLLFGALQGVAQSTGWSNTNKAMSSWFSVNERGRVMGWWCTHYPVGTAVALAFAGWMMDHFSRARFTEFPLPPATLAGLVSPYVLWAASAPISIFSTIAPYWPAAFFGPAAVVAGITLLSWLLLRNRPEDVGLPPIEEYHGDVSPATGDAAAIVAAPENSWQRIAAVLATPRIWTLALAYFSVKMVRYAFISWGPIYVAEAAHSGALASAMVTAVMPIGGLLGVVAAGYLSDKLFGARRIPVAVLSLVACAAVMCAGLVRFDNAWIVAVFFFLVGAFLWGPDSIMALTASVDFGTKRGAGTAVGFVNGIGSLGAVLGGWLPGYITTGSNWKPLFEVLIVGLIVSSIVLLPLWSAKASTD